jgi:hypothetical protein
MIFPMTSFHRSWMGALLVLAGFFGALPVHAVGLFQECQAADANYTYTCYDVQTCIVSGGNPLLSCGIGAPQGAICCATPKPPAPPPVTCKDQGGACKITCEPDEASIGQFDCLTGGYSCCKSKALLPVEEAGTTGGLSQPGPTAAQPQAAGQLALPACVKTGNCTLDDIVRTGVNFATFIMGLAGALFFAVFIYGGALYLTSFGNASQVKKGQEAIKGAVIGMIFVIGAWTIVNTLVKGLTGQSDQAATGQADKCVAQGEGYSCVTLNGTTAQQAVADGSAKGYDCKTGLCTGAVNVLCCKLK